MMNACRKTCDVSQGVLLLVLFLLGWAVLSHVPNNILSWDIFGYYLYLPFTFIYHDLGLRNFEIVQNILDQYHNTHWFYQALPQEAGHWVMKYPMGMAVLYLPWFFTGHLWALASGFPADGFSTPYQLSLLYGSFVYTATGLVYFRKSLRKFFNPIITSIVLISIVFGTNFMVLTVFHGQGLMSHNYLFFLFSLLLWNTLRWHEKPDWLHTLAIAFIMGLSALSRSTEILVAGIPLLWGVADAKTLKEKWLLVAQHKTKITVIILVVAAIGSLQLFYYKAYTGKFIFNSYGANAGEGMEFLHPYILEVLFSFRKGWLLYTPMMGLSLLGFVSLYRSRKELFWSIFLFFIVSFYVIASWSCWWYADSYSQRPLIPMYVFLSLPLGFLIQNLFDKGRTIRWLILTLLAILLGFNLFQSWQFLRGIIHSSRMTQPYYEAVFLKTQIPEGATKLLLIDRNKDPKLIFEEDSFSARTIVVQNLEADAAARPSPDGSMAVELRPDNPFSSAIDLVYSQHLAVKDYGLLRITALVYCQTPPDDNPTSLTATFMHKMFAYNYRNQRLTNAATPLGHWVEAEMLYLIPEVRRPDDIFRFTVYHTGQMPVWVKNVKIELLEPKNSSQIR